MKRESESDDGEEALPPCRELRNLTGDWPSFQLDFVIHAQQTLIAGIALFVGEEEGEVEGGNWSTFLIVEIGGRGLVPDFRLDSQEADFYNEYMSITPTGLSGRTAVKGRILAGEVGGGAAALLDTQTAYILTSARNVEPRGEPLETES